MPYQKLQLMNNKLELTDTKANKVLMIDHLAMAKEKKIIVWQSNMMSAIRYQTATIKTLALDKGRYELVWMQDTTLNNDTTVNTMGISVNGGVEEWQNEAEGFNRYAGEKHYLFNIEDDNSSVVLRYRYLSYTNMFYGNLVLYKIDGYANPKVEKWFDGNLEQGDMSNGTLRPDSNYVVTSPISCKVGYVIKSTVSNSTAVAILMFKGNTFKRYEVATRDTIEYTIKASDDCDNFRIQGRNDAGLPIATTTVEVLVNGTAYKTNQLQKWWDGELEQGTVDTNTGERKLGQSNRVISSKVICKKGDIITPKFTVPSGTNTLWIAVHCYDKNGTYKSYDIDQSSPYEVTITKDNTAYAYVVFGFAGNVAPTEVTNCQIYVNNTLGRILYEGNWFDNNWENIAYQSDTKKWVINSDKSWLGDRTFIPCKNGDKIVLTLSRAIRSLWIIFFSDNNEGALLSSVGDLAQNSNTISTTAPNGAKYFSIQIGTVSPSYGTITPDIAPYGTITINGKLATIVDTYGGKNLVNLNNRLSVGKYIDNGTIANATTVKDKRMLYIECQPNTRYIISHSYSPTTMRVISTSIVPYEGVVGTNYKQFNNTNKFEYTTSPNAKYLAIQTNIDADGQIGDVIAESLVISEINRTYLPHNGIYSLNELRDEIVVDDGSYKELHNTFAIDLGDRNWLYNVDNKVFYTQILDAKIGSISLLCEEYEPTDTSVSVATMYAQSGDKRIGRNSANTYIYIKDTSKTSAPTPQNNWLKGVKLIYELAEPYYTDLPQEPYYQIRTFDEETNIEVVSDVDVDMQLLESIFDTKTDWQVTDYMNADDYNRIKFAIETTKDLVSTMNEVTDFEDMGNDILYGHPAYAEDFNKFEHNVKAIDKYNVGFAEKTWQPNGSTPLNTDLNRIEGAIEKTYNQAERYSAVQNYLGEIFDLL